MMEQERLSELYGQMCRKAARNAQKIGSDLREFPGRRDGQYFAPPRDSLRPLSHIFCWTQSFYRYGAAGGRTHR